MTPSAAVQQDASPRSVGDLVGTIQVALRWAGSRNPNRAVLQECVLALTDLSMQLRDAHAEIARLRGESPMNMTPSHRVDTGL